MCKSLEWFTGPVPIGPYRQITAQLSSAVTACYMLREMSIYLSCSEPMAEGCNMYGLGTIRVE